MDGWWMHSVTEQVAKMSVVSFGLYNCIRQGGSELWGRSRVRRKASSNKPMEKRREKKRRVQQAGNGKLSIQYYINCAIRM